MKIQTIIISLIFFGISCNLFDNEEIKKPDYELQFINSVNISVSEPSGLTLSQDKESLYIVSDIDGEIFKLNLSGDVLQKIKLGKKFNLEGICQDQNPDYFWVLEEENREVIKIDLSGNILLRKKILDGNDNDGLEGICIGANGNLVLLKEKNPAYFIELDSLLNIITQIELKYESDFAGIVYNPTIQQYMILNQQAQKLSFFNPNSDLVREIDIPMDRAEGIAFNSSTNIVYIVDENESKLYSYLLDVIN